MVGFEHKKHEFTSGTMMALPIVVGYIAIGIPFGILAVKNNLPIWSVGLMSLFIFAGSSQFVAVSLMGVGSGIWPIVSATFLLNLRHFLMGMSLGDALPKIRPLLAAYLSQSITDETYGVNIIKTRDSAIIPPMNMLGTNVVAHASWVLATIIGAWLGNVIPIDSKYTSGALPIMFAVLLALQLKNLKHFVLAAMAIAFTVLFIQMFSGNWPFLVTALVVPTLATIYEVIRK